MAPQTRFLPTDVSFCSCRYSTWGYWIADIQGNADPGVPNEMDQHRVHRVHLGTWVAGELPALQDIPFSGTATYRGHINGSVVRNATKYQAVGSFQNTWNFSENNGTIAITNFDGVNYSGAATSVNRRDFVGSLMSLSGPQVRTGDLKGSFFAGGGSAVAEQGGGFRIDGVTDDYKASGTFQAKR